MVVLAARTTPLPALVRAEAVALLLISAPLPAGPAPDRVRVLILSFWPFRSRKPSGLLTVSLQPL